MVAVYRICPAAFLVSTFSMMRSRRPFSSKMNVRRRVPRTVLPYIFFSPQAPKAWSISVEGSDNNRNGNSNLAWNLECEAAESLLTPTTL